MTIRLGVIKAVAAVLLGALGAVGIGAFLGYPVDADAAYAHIDRLKDLSDRESVSPAEIENLYGVKSYIEAGALRRIRSIFQWHRVVTGLALFVAFLSIRPPRKEALAIGALSAIAATIWCGALVGAAVIAAVAAYATLAPRLFQERPAPRS